MSLLALALVAAPSAEGVETEPAPASSPVRVHDHTALSFNVPDGPRAAAQRAAEASRNLNAIIDENVPGAVTVLMGHSAASVQVDARQMFRLVPQDALAAGESDLGEYAQQVQASLDSFLTKERRRAQLQRAVLSVSLVVFVGLLAYFFLRLVHRWTRAWEKRLLQVSGARHQRWLGLGLSSERSRGVILVLLAAARFFVSGAVVYVFLLVSLSLFERTEAWRNQLASWVTLPLLALGARLLHGVPNVILMVVLFAVVQGGWRSLSLVFERAAVGEARLPGVRQNTVVPLRLLARAGLIVAALLLIPLVTGYEGDLFTRVGFLLLGGLALGLVPLLATVCVGTYVLIRQEYALGEWVSLRTPGGHELSGEVTQVDFLHLRLVPEEGGEVRIPHLIALWSPVVHLPGAKRLVLSFEIPLLARAPAMALETLRTSANEVLKKNGLLPAAEVRLAEVTPLTARFELRPGEARDSLRSELLLALSAALAEPLPDAPLERAP